MYIAKLLRLYTALQICCSSLSQVSANLLSPFAPKSTPTHQWLQPGSVISCEKPVLTGPIEATACDYETLEGVNEKLYGHLGQLVKTPFFKYFQVDLYRDCPFWQDNALCMSRQCGVTPLDESDVPEKWRAAALSAIELPPLEERNQLPGCYYRDSDFCFLDDLTEGQYYDLSLIPERYTGYAGPSAQRVWGSIYNENCFGITEASFSKTNETVSRKTSLSKVPSIENALLTKDAFRRMDVVDDEQCVEKQVFYKIVSGLHASISTHVCHEDIDQATGEWRPNLQCFITRIASHPERLQYIYFNTVLLLRAVARIGPYLSAYDDKYCSSGEVQEAFPTVEPLGKVLDIANTVGKFDETVLFRDENAPIVKEELKSHFRNVTRIMDCVSCDKCRLWGKVQTTGVATALKILFELDEKTLDPRFNDNVLQRSEVVALINTLHRFSESIHAAEQFRQMWAVVGENDASKAGRVELGEEREILEKLEEQLQKEKDERRGGGAGEL